MMMIRLRDPALCHANQYYSPPQHHAELLSKYIEYRCYIRLDGWIPTTAAARSSQGGMLRMLCMQ